MQYKEVTGGICAPKGFAAAGVHCGIRANHSEKYDLALIKADVRCAAAGVYTTNKVCGAPIKVDRAHLTDGYAQAIVVNSGNANTCAANGVALAEECCELVGKALNIDAKDVLPSSTGVIGQPMVIDPFARGIPAAAAKLAADAQGSTDAATAIMTTDTHKKEYAIQFELGGKICTVGAIGKGSGMIAPNMATMLAFYTTDAAVSPALLEKALKTVVPGTYNQMSVDLDTSTNDTLIIMASGLAGNPEITEENADYHAFVAALTAIASICALSTPVTARARPTSSPAKSPTPPTSRRPAPSAAAWSAPTSSRPLSLAATPTGAASSAPSATLPVTSRSIRSASGCPAPPVRSTSARTPPTTPTARTRPQRCWPSTIFWSRWIWAPVTPAPRHGAAI